MIGVCFSDTLNSMDTLHLDTEKLLTTFLEMVRIDSPSGEEGAMRAYLQERLDTLEITHRTDPAGNLIADIPAHRCPHLGTLVFSGHMDVVPPCVNVTPRVEGAGEKRVIYSDNTTVLGADDKAGLAAILEALSLSIQNSLPRPAIRLLFTVREETYLGGAKDLADEALQADFAVTLDHTGHPGTIIHQAPSYFEWTVQCTGKSVHAGIMPEKGVHALTFAARIIERLHLGRIDAETTANVGFWEGGKATNIVPDSVTLRGELRGHNPSTLDTELQYIQHVLAEEKAAMPGADFTFEACEEFRAYQLDAQHPGVVRVMDAARRTGLVPQLVLTNGGSDNNVFVQRGLPGVVLSACYVNPHALTEHVHLAEMRQSTEFLLNILEQFATRGFRE